MFYTMSFTTRLREEGTGSERIREKGRHWYVSLFSLFYITNNVLDAYDAFYHPPPPKIRTRATNTTYQPPWAPCRERWLSGTNAGQRQHLPVSTSLQDPESHIGNKKKCPRDV